MYSVVQQQYVIVTVTATYMERLRKGKRLVLRVVFLLAQPAGLAEEHHRVKHVAAVHAGGAFADLVGVESEKPPLRVHRASHALESALRGREFERHGRDACATQGKETGGRCCFVVVTLARCHYLARGHETIPYQVLYHVHEILPYQVPRWYLVQLVYITTYLVPVTVYITGYQVPVYDTGTRYFIDDIRYQTRAHVSHVYLYLYSRNAALVCSVQSSRKGEKRRCRGGGVGGNFRPGPAFLLRDCISDLHVLRGLHTARSNTVLTMLKVCN